VRGNIWKGVYAVEPVCAGELLSAGSLAGAPTVGREAKREGAKNAGGGGGRSIFQLALNKYLHAFQRARRCRAISSYVCSYVPSCAPNTSEKRGELYAGICAMADGGTAGEGGNNSSDGIRRTEEAGATKRKSKRERERERERERRGAPAGCSSRIDERERTERNFAFNQPSNETARPRWLASQRGKARGIKRGER